MNENVTAPPQEEDGKAMKITRWVIWIAFIAVTVGIFVSLGLAR